MLEDTFGRFHNYLRISLTDNCNLRCFYCMPDEDHSFTPHQRLMRPDEIETLAKLFVAAGVTKIRLTGGEPFVRKDIDLILHKLSTLNIELAITTNGTTIHRHVQALKAAGVRSVNISLDTLQADKFFLITRRDLFHQVRANIELLIAEGFRVKINAVVVKGMNDNEVVDFIAWTKASPVEVRFIEFMPFDGNQWNGKKVFSLAEILQTVGEQYEFSAKPGLEHDTAKTYTIPGHPGSFSVISTMSDHFCGTCNRIRLTADGKLKSCLFSTGESDLLSALRRGDDLELLIRSNISAKKSKLGGQWETGFLELMPEVLQNRTMIAIGG